jgi:uncharacterized protein YegP (UPF0339 family)
MGLLDKILGSNAERQEYALIKKITHGKFKGEYRFVLKGANNEIVATSETYKNKADILDLLDNLFPNFMIVDKSK